MLPLMTTVVWFFVEITSPNFPKPFAPAGTYPTMQACQDDLPNVVAEWSAKTDRAGKNIFGSVAGECKPGEVDK